MWESTATYADLQVFLQEPGCAICRVVDQSSRRYFDDLLYENVNDVTLRKRLRDGGGFCRAHAQTLVGFGEALGTAILYGDLLNQRRRWLHEGAASRVLPAGRAALELGRDCPACEMEHQSERRAAEVLSSALNEGKIGALWQGSDGLCWPHFLLVRGLCHAGRKELDHVESECLDRLAGLVTELIASYDYQWKGTRSPQVASAWRHVVAMVTGQFIRDGAEAAPEPEEK